MGIGCHPIKTIRYAVMMGAVENVKVFKTPAGHNAGNVTKKTNRLRQTPI